MANKREVMAREALLLFSILLVTLTASAQKKSAAQGGIADSCGFAKIEMERLADLNVPRSGHVTLSLNGEFVVMGGHTNGFVPTSTAEYYKDGKWHLMKMVYEHDDPLCVVLHSGKVLIAGGHEKPLGIGQTFPTEFYYPDSHRFEGFGCLDKKRTLANGVEIDSGRVVISGNWYHDDGMEEFDGRKFFSPVKTLSAQRCSPYLFRTSGNDVMVLGTMKSFGGVMEHVVIDRLRGEPFSVPLLDEWKPLPIQCNYRSDDSFIGDMASGVYAYLMAVVNDEGQVAIARVDDTRFSLLPTTRAVPMKGPWGTIDYALPLIVDRQHHRAFLVGKGVDERIYVVCIDYSLQPAPLTLYYTEPLPKDCFCQPVVTPEGDLLMAGGSTDDNFTPSAQVYLLRLANHPQKSNAANQPLPWLLLWVASIVLALGIFYSLLRRKYHRRKQMQHDEVDIADSEPAGAVQSTGMLADDGSEQLMQRIKTLMETQKPYLNSDLKVSDIADAFGIHRNEVSACINSQTGSTFTQYVNGYRIDHAKQLMREKPMKKIHAVWMESGFANETSFFRTFKAFTGMTPREWLQKESEND